MGHSTVGIVALAWLICVGQAVGEEPFLFEARFETDVIGKPPKGWTITNVGKIEVVDSGDAAHGKAVRIVDSGAGGGMSRVIEEIKSGVISVEYEFLKRKGSTGGDVELMYVSHERLGDLTGVDVAMTNGDPSFLNYHNGGWVRGPEIATEVWHLVTYRIDIGKLKWGLEFDGKKIGDNFAFRDFGEKSLNRLNWANILNGGSTFDLMLDNVLVYKGVERPVLAVSPGGKMAIEWGWLKKKRNGDLSSVSKYDRVGVGLDAWAGALLTSHWVIDAIKEFFTRARERRRRFRTVALPTARIVGFILCLWVETHPLLGPSTPTIETI